MAEFDDGLELGVPPAYYDTWNRHNSMAFCNYKGLRNAPGENNCFLNSAVQVFWHLDVFRRSYRRLTGHSCMGNSCIFCALKAIFTQFQYSDQSSLPPDTLRKALAETFVDQHRYQLGHMDDAAECFENILRRIHLHVATDHNEDTCTAAHCLSHQKFAMTVFDQVVCPCGAKTEPLRFHELVHYVSASALVSQAKQMQETGDLLHPDRFGLLLRNAVGMGDVRNCPSLCGKKVQMRRTLLNCPDVVSIGLIWDSERPNGELVTDVARCLGTTIMLQDVFHSVMSDDITKLPKLNLSALVCYYGKHYSTFVFHSKLKVWIYFDDATVREIGPRWEDVVQKCVRSRYQPLLLLYTNPYPTVLPVQTAPQKTTMHPGYKKATTVSPNVTKTKRDPRAAFVQQRAAVGRRAVTPGPEINGSSEHAEPETRRAVTPGPEHYAYESERDIARKGGVEHHRHNSFLVAMTGKSESNSSTGGPHNRNDVTDSQELLGEYVYYNGTVQPSFKHAGERYESQNTMSSHMNNNYQRNPGFQPEGFGNIPSFGIVAQGNDMQRKESFKKGNKAHGDVIRYMVDQTRIPSSGGDQKIVSQKKSGNGRHSRSRSQSYEDTLSISSETNPQVANSKSRSNPYNPDSNQALHGPVQSGLATLPRKKTDQRVSKSPSPTTCVDMTDQTHERQGSASSTGSVVLNPKYQQGKVNNNNRSEYMDQKHFVRKPEPGSSNGRQPLHDNGHHWHQVSSSSQGSQSTLTPSVGDLGCQDDTRSPAKHTHHLSPHGQARPNLPGGAPPHMNLQEDAVNKDYISRNMVEKILSKQRLQRQASSASSMSVRSNTSSSSIESDIYVQKSKSKGGKDSLSVEIPYDSLSLESQKDSGYGSSDRNSSSSTGSITMDPFSQYFISRSMIPPKTVNDYAFMQKFTDSFKESMANMEKEDTSSVDSPYETMEYNNPSAYTVNYVQQQQQLQHIHSQNMTQNREQPQKNKNISPVKSQLKSGPSGTRETVPLPSGSQNIDGLRPSDQSCSKKEENDLINFKSGIQVNDILPGYSEVVTGKLGTDEFLNLCHKAEEMMDRCMLAETTNDTVNAINCCTAAMTFLKQAMQLPQVSQQSYVFAQRKHNSCVMKHRSLQKHSPTNLEGNVFSSSSETLNSSSANRSSMTSNDSDGSQRDLIQLDAQGKTQKDVFKEKLQDLYKQGVKVSISQAKRPVQTRPNVGKPAPPQRGVSIGSKSIPINKQSSLPCRNSSPVSFNQHSTSPQKDSNVNSESRPHCSVPKSVSPNPDSSNSRDAELYQSYLNHRRNVGSGKFQQCQSSSGTSTPTASLDGSGSDGSRSEILQTHMGKSYSKAEIRHLLQQNMLQRQNPQGVAPMRATQQQGPYFNGGSTDPRSAASYPQDTVDGMVRNSGKPQSMNAQRSSLPAAEPRGSHKPPIACKPVVNGDYKPQSMHPNSIPNRMPPSDYQTRDFVYGPQSRTAERYTSQPDCSSLYKQQQRACSSEHSYLIPTTPLGRDKISRLTYSSQPDLSTSGVEAEPEEFPPPASLSAPSTPAHSAENLQDIDCKPSVKDIASRFEASVTMAPMSRVGRQTPDNIGRAAGPYRQRSKSESSSGPKPALKKRKKPKARGPRKSVTFSDSIALIAAAEELPPGPAPPPYEEAVNSRNQDRLGWDNTDTYYGYDSDDDIVKVVPAGYTDDDSCDKDSCASSESPVEAAEVMCSLCRKKGAEPGVSYCSNCRYYMSRFQPSR